MSYAISIGDADDNDGEVCILELSEAPAFHNDPLSKHRNYRDAGYVQWENFSRVAGLHDVFFDPRHGLMREHPGTFGLGPEHLKQIREARRLCAPCS